jgi:hypothetical protein
MALAAIVHRTIRRNFYALLCDCLPWAAFAIFQVALATRLSTSTPDERKRHKCDS